MKRTRLRLRSPAAWLALALAPSCWIGCGPGPSASPSTILAADSVGGSVLIRSYHDYAGTVPTGVRERVVLAPDGRSKVELLELNGQARADLTSPEAILAFDQLATLYGRGVGNYILKVRDFHVVNGDLFDQNYTWQVIATNAAVAGRPCAMGQVMPRSLDRPWYEVWVDIESHQTLKYIEHLPSGVVAAEMETLSVEFNVDTSGEQFPTPQVGTSTPVTIDTIGSFLPPNFKAWLPDGPGAYLPAGFAVSAIEVTTLVGFPTIRWRCTDGAQEILIAEYPELPQNAKAALSPSPDEPTQVNLMTFGAFTNTDFVLGANDTDHGTRVFVLGKVEPVELQFMIEGMRRVH